jgi:site-specific recombinase XerD
MYDASDLVICLDDLDDGTAYAVCLEDLKEREGDHSLRPLAMVPPSEGNSQTVASMPQKIDQSTFQAATNYLTAAKSKNTRESYKKDWAQFERWCEARGLRSLPASSGNVALYLADRANTGSKTSSLRRYLVAISQAHRMAGFETPRRETIVKELIKGIARTHGTEQKHKKAITVDQLRAMISACDPETAMGLRDRAILLLGFAGALRRSEIARLNVEDLEICPEGLTIHLRRSKTDQGGKGRKIGIPYAKEPDLCPVWAVWKHLAKRPERGPLFTTKGSGGRRITGKVVYRLIKKLCARIGIDPALFSAHSLRAGFITAAVRAGKPSVDIMRHTGHRSLSVFHRYIEQGTLFDSNPADGIL